MKEKAKYVRASSDSQEQNGLSFKDQHKAITEHALSLGYKPAIVRLVYPAIITPCVDKDGYTVEVPDLPGCSSEGTSLAEAIDMGAAAACEWILGRLGEGNDFPAASEYYDIQPQPGSFVNLLVLDVSRYAERYGNKSVRRNVTLPAWLDTFATYRDINCSKVLQNALLTLAQSHK